MPTVKHVSYSGVSLLYPTVEHAAWLASVHDPRDVIDFSPWNYDQPAMPSVPTPPVPLPPNFEFNRLWWPTGASRPAWFHGVVNGTKLAQIKAAVGNYAAPASLVLYDGRETVTATMRMLPERPLNTTLGTTGEQGWIITLTDERFFWYYKRGVVTVPSSWTDLFSQLAALLGTAITVDTVAPEYGVPSRKWALAYENTNVLLDAAAAQVGQRVVVGLDGAVRTVNWETARTESSTQFTALLPVTSGGVTTEPGIARTVPEAVTTVFADVSAGTFNVGTYPVTNYLFPLGISQYGDASGVPGFHETVFADTAYDGTNAAACAAYASAAAVDDYGWMLPNVDAAYPGVSPWVPCGWEDRVEWIVRLGTNDEPFAETLVRRGPYLSMVGGNYGAGYSIEASGPCCASGLPGQVPVYGSGGYLTWSSFSNVTTYSAPSGGHQTVFTVTPAPTTQPQYVTTTNPTYQFVINNYTTTGPTYQFTVSLSGTSFAPQYTFVVGGSLVYQQYTFQNPSGGGPITIQQQFTNQTANVVQYTIGTTGGQGVQQQFTIDPTDQCVTAIQQQYTLCGASGDQTSNIRTAPGASATTVSRLSNMSFDVGPAPAVPTGVSITPGNTENTIDFTPTAGCITRIYSSTTTGGNPYTADHHLIDLDVGENTYTHTGLTNGTTYYYVMAAVTLTGGQSGVTAEDSGTPAAAPTTFTTPGSNTFTAPTDGDYFVECWGPGGNGENGDGAMNGGAGGGGGAYAASTLTLTAGNYDAYVGSPGETTVFNVDDVVADFGLDGAGAGGSGGLASASTGDTTYSGGDGAGAGGTDGGGGGSSAGTAAAGDPGSGTTGGTAPSGGGDGGDAPSNNGVQPGGGGAGGNATGSTAGGSGADGQITVTGPL